LLFFFLTLQEMERLVQQLGQLTDSLRAKSQQDSKGPPLPTNIDVQLCAARTALHTELAVLREPANKSATDLEEEVAAEVSVRRSVWRALVALQGQLELGQEKRAEFERIVNTASAAHQ
jgi:hypothetical protein